MDDARRMSRLCCSPAVPAIDYWASEEEFQQQVAEYRKAVETWGPLVDNDQLFSDANGEFALLQADPDAWAEYVKERELWDVTLLDGLRDDPYFG